ncbi:hypothetical protein Tco_1218279 [Tanacetum coccineum]
MISSRIFEKIEKVKSLVSVIKKKLSLCHCLLTLSFLSEIFKSLSFRLDRLCHLAILCLDQYAHTLHHLESLLTISLDRLDIFEGRSCISEFVQKPSRAIVKNTYNRVLGISSPSPSLRYPVNETV